jgi:hypothetical protein
VTPQEARAILFDWQNKTEGARVQVHALTPTPTVKHQATAEVVHGDVSLFNLRTGQASEDDALVVLAEHLPAEFAKLNPEHGRECPACKGRIKLVQKPDDRMAFSHSLPWCKGWGRQQ